MTEEELKSRVKSIALRVIRLVQSLPKNLTGEIIGRQLIRSATSVAANYYSACKARSKADFLNKLGIVEEEADETQFWIELIIESGLMKESRLNDLLGEFKEITAIMASSRITVKGLRKYDHERVG
jgi:four helix bundle protein